MRTHPRRIWLVLAAAALGAVQVSPARANSTGIVGFSGKQGQICNECHSGGTAPVVQFDGPTDVTPSAMATFHFVVQSQAPGTQTFAGFNVAVSDGQLAVVPGQGEIRAGGELTHSTPKANDADGRASFEFTWQAPDAPGTYTLFGAGNSVNRNANDLGDQPSSTTLDVVVELAPTPTPTPVSGTCVGDCDHDGNVTVTELIKGVNIVLGTIPVDECLAFATNSDRIVTVAQLLQAVNAVLNGCGQ